MKKETLDRANELEEQIGKYEAIARIMRYPYQTFRLFKKRVYISKGGGSDSVCIEDSELAKLVEEYCRDKIESLKVEIEAL